jgi:hypothetical protein
MANTGFKGVDVRQNGTDLLFRAFLLDIAGALVTTGTTSLYLYELQDDGTLKSYDFNDNTFKTTALTTETVSMTHRTGNNSTTNTGLWTYALATLSGFTQGAVYFARVVNSNASPSGGQTREFQFGLTEGDVETAVTTALDAQDIDGYTPAEALRVILALSAGVSAGFLNGSGSVTFDAADGSKVRISATVDSHGNRTGITIDATP